MKKSKDYYKNEDGSYYINDEGLRVKKPQPATNKGSSDAEKSRSAGRMRVAAKKSALASMRNKKKNQIPASPTR
jgi:hypothetical protein